MAYLTCFEWSKIPWRVPNKYIPLTISFAPSFPHICAARSPITYPPPTPAHTSVNPTHQPSSSPPCAITFHLPLFPLSRSPKWVHSALGGCLGSVNYAHLSWRSIDELGLRTPPIQPIPHHTPNHPCWLGPHGPNQNYNILCVQSVTAV